MKFTAVIATIVSMAAFAMTAPIANEGMFFLVSSQLGATTNEKNSSRRSPEPRHVCQGHCRRHRADRGLLETYTHGWRRGRGRRTKITTSRIEGDANGAT